jgi:zinc D-Ala-D-Ala carboxypeptidase
MLKKGSSVPLCRIFAIIGIFVSIQPQWSEGTDLSRVRSALAAANLSPMALASILPKIDAAPKPFQRYLTVVLADRREDSLPEAYAPTDLVPLEGTGLSVSRAGHRLRKNAFQALKAMDLAARTEGVTLLISSSYRSFAYQVEVWNRSVAADGMAETEISVARPGHSQHQLGTVIDFGSITDAFAATKASHWLAVNAHRFGFSLSFPKDMMPVTGYKWESWHYRFIGEAAASLENEYFGGIQHHLLSFLDKL